MKWVSAVGAAAMLLALPAVAQETLPFQMQNKSIVAPETRAANDAILTTKDNAAPALPWQQPVQVAPPGAQAVPAPVPGIQPGGPVPFGKSTASQYQPIQESPHTATAGPVENIDAVQTSQPAPAAPAPPEADPANEDPSAPTELTAPIFSAEEHAPPRIAVVKVLNKVTARAQTVELRGGQMQKVGKLEVKASYCQRSAPSSLPDAAALLEIAEEVPGEEKVKPLFSGWMYQSSPSVSALEHPVYDVTLVECKDIGPTVQPKEKSEEKPKKAKKK
jgi:hypothetical protein